MAADPTEKPRLPGLGDDATTPEIATTRAQRLRRRLLSSGRTNAPEKCRWINQAEALREFAVSAEKTESQLHIKPLHFYVASRLVIEGGFHPDSITPRPPFNVVSRGKELSLEYAPDAAGHGELTVLGGLKTKNVDVVVSLDGIGPALAVSCKGMTRSLRNLTNRMEETLGESTNLHSTYPALCLGYLFVIRATRAADVQAQTALQRAVQELPPDIDDDDAEEALVEDAERAGGGARETQRNDVAIGHDDSPVEGLVRFHAALLEIANRRGVRDDFSRYESVAFALIDVHKAPGTVLDEYPFKDSPLRLERFFKTLYLRYDERYVFGAPSLGKKTRRRVWSPESPAFAHRALSPDMDYAPRLSE